MTPLWRQLQAAASVLQAIREGTSATPALAAVDAPLRPGVQALVFHALRHLGRAEVLRSLLANRTPPPKADALLCLALALAWRAEDAPYEPFTLVNQAVEAANRGPAKAQASFLNACLRRFLREREELVAISERDPVAVWNHPRWWIQRLKKEQPERWQAVLAANNRHAPMTLRINQRKSTVAHFIAALTATNIGAEAVGASGVQLNAPHPVQAIPGFESGTFSVQDAAAQLAAPLLLRELDTRQPLRLLDACAAPGGKTAHLLELADAHVTALDIDAQRCERIHQNLQRLGLRAEVVAADAANPDAWWNGLPFDGILLDAPCTASGIVRRHPDVRWLRRESDIAQLAGIQAQLLHRLWPLLRPGGRMLYCTCSVFQAEGREQIETFLTRHTDAVFRPSPGHLMPQNGVDGQTFSDNGLGDNDGFFYALLEKRVV
ncbi:16S rRNA (cytosine(967)-C(5))-methyltransferase [Rhodoferax koreense]|uniref:16S rRNA (cytosine(967)-C(5))-methyltransferase n=1 Tax=Rhodoferax koreensis TaxID=1842727 RepID=A0A1P8JRR5_9BURK|nr:16S rRNA (cytosine(967)-C(5))-methyltransferase RsmB [Rhodoferax koreense]APW36415.1 16S rRNA (cytosine(967)-C(5))-methyltransferase [Rhodoferax koreense]